MNGTQLLIFLCIVSAVVVFYFHEIISQRVRLFLSGSKNQPSLSPDNAYSCEDTVGGVDQEADYYWLHPEHIGTTPQTHFVNPDVKEAAYHRWGTHHKTVALIPSVYSEMANEEATLSSPESERYSNYLEDIVGTKRPFPLVFHKDDHLEVINTFVTENGAQLQRGTVIIVVSADIEYIHTTNESHQNHYMIGKNQWHNLQKTFRNAHTIGHPQVEAVPKVTSGSCHGVNQCIVA